LGSSDVITADAGKQFVAREFRQYAGNMRITVKTAFVEAHHSIGMMKRYHDPLRRVYAIITTEISSIDLEIALQMTFKAINDSVGFDGLVPTLLVFGAYPRMTEMDASSPSITQRAIAMKRVMEEVQKFNATRQVNDALHTRNGPNPLIYNLSLNSPVLVFREGKGNQSGAWKGPFKLLNIQGESAIIELPNEPTKFRSTSVKPYYQDDHADNNDELPPSSAEPPIGSSISPPIESSIESSIDPPVESTPEHTDPIVPTGPVKRGRGRSRKFLSPAANVIFNIISVDSSFTAFRQKEIADLLEKEVFLPINKRDVSSNIRIFNSRFVDEVKNPGTEKAFEKSRLMVQAFNDQNKTLVLTQSSIIQRVSQRLIICLAASLSQIDLYLRDITQAYVQSRSNLNRDFYVQSLSELIKLMGISNNCILKVVKPLYDVPKADNH
jgi:hypothetical protein